MNEELLAWRGSAKAHPKLDEFEGADYTENYHTLITNPK